MYSVGTDSLVTEIQKYYQLCERESYYNLEYSKNVIALRLKCFEGWYDFKFLYQRNPKEALRYHQWIFNPRSSEYINFKQYVRVSRTQHRLMSSKLEGIIKTSEKLKKSIAAERGGKEV